MVFGTDCRQRSWYAAGHHESSWGQQNWTASCRSCTGVSTTNWRLICGYFCCTENIRIILCVFSSDDSPLPKNEDLLSNSTKQMLTSGDNSASGEERPPARFVSSHLQSSHSPSVGPRSSHNLTALGGLLVDTNPNQGILLLITTIYRYSQIHFKSTQTQTSRLHALCLIIQQFRRNRIVFQLELLERRSRQMYQLAIITMRRTWQWSWACWRPTQVWAVRSTTLHCLGHCPNLSIRGP